MPVIFGSMAQTVDEIVSAFNRYGDRVLGPYRAHYRYDARTADPYSGVRLERPESLSDNPSEVVFPWEQIFTAAAACAGSDYPMLAAHFGVPLDRVDFTVEGIFDPRGEFDGLAGFEAPESARYCYRSLHLRARVVSSAASASIEDIHRRVLANNMVLGALRGVPQTSELTIVPAAARETALSGGWR